MSIVLWVTLVVVMVALAYHLALRTGVQEPDEWSVEILRGRDLPGHRGGTFAWCTRVYDGDTFSKAENIWPSLGFDAEYPFKWAARLGAARRLRQLRAAGKGTGEVMR